MKKIKKKNRKSMQHRPDRTPEPVLSPSDRELYADIADVDFGYAYDPSREIDAQRWLALDEATRIFAVAQHHMRAAQPWGKSLRMHAMAHTAAENQLTKDYAPSVDAMRRLRSGGLTRHQAIHAIASETMDIMHDAVHSERDVDMDAELEARLRVLTAEAWLATAQ